MPSKAKKTKAFQQKAKAAQGHANNSSFGGRNGLQSTFMPFDGTASPRRGHNGFTLQEEARNTERHQSFWNTDQRLRDSKVSFVSAGTLDPKELELESKNTENALAEMTLDSPREDAMGQAMDVPPEEDAKKMEDVVLEKDTEESGVQSPIEETPAYFVVDTMGEPVNTRLPLPKVRSTSPTPSNSSEEVILFGGRDRNGTGVSRARKAHKPQVPSIDAKIRTVEDQIHVREELLEEVLREKSASPLRLMRRQSKTPATHQNPGPNRTRKANRQQEDEDAILADYLANLDEDDELNNTTFRPRELGGAEDDLWQDEMEESSEEPIPDNIDPVQGGWDPSDIGDFDEMSTSDEVMGSVKSILTKRDRESGVQYLVVWQGQSADEARWVPLSTLTAASALPLIEAFEAQENILADILNHQNEDSSDTDGAEDDDSDLVQRKIDRMSDEKIARLLAKQEELGMGSDKLLLFDDEPDDEDEDDVDIDLPKTVLNPFLLGPTLDQYTGRGARRPRGDYPSASALADSYDGFDVMDHDRPSLKRKPKGRKGKLTFDVSDEELDASMQMTYENDRLKKKERKQEREELRAQGLLGSKNGKPDLKQKFKEGMSIHDVKDAIKDFLTGNTTTLSLPPMDKADRKVVHELGQVFYLKTKSIGKGTSRFPILTKTARTPRSFASNTFDAAEARLSRRYLPRMDVGNKKRAQRAPRGGNNAGVSYRDGDVVGGSAPELGAENIGRAMLEKMGWSNGTALGALNNKGILQPVSHVVKTTKAGLG